VTTTPESTKGVPRIVNNPAPTLRADFNSLADWVRDNTDPSAANLAALPSTGNWVGRTRYVVDVDAVYVYKGTSLGWQRTSKQFETVAFSGTSDGSGFISVPHSLGVSPDTEQVTLRASTSDAVTLIQDVVVWSKSNTAVLLRFIRRDTSAYFTGNPFNGSVLVARTTF
jgi:hypothetical protein